MKKNSYRGLKNILIFVLAALVHIFEGVLKDGRASGYHHQGIPNTPGQVIPGTELLLGEFDVYLARVMVNGVIKTSNNGYSTFFPKTMTPQEVVDAINEAYQNRVILVNNCYTGFASSGMEIHMTLGRKDKVLAAYPIYNPLP